MIRLGPDVGYSAAGLEAKFGVLKKGRGNRSHIGSSMLTAEVRKQAARRAAAHIYPPPIPPPAIVAGKRSKAHTYTAMERGEVRLFFAGNPGALGFSLPPVAEDIPDTCELLENVSVGGAQYRTLSGEEKLQTQHSGFRAQFREPAERGGGEVQRTWYGVAERIERVEILGRELILVRASWFDGIVTLCDVTGLGQLRGPARAYGGADTYVAATQIEGRAFYVRELEGGMTTVFLDRHIPSVDAAPPVRVE
jgi:hypothetical protein